MVLQNQRQRRKRNVFLSLQRRRKMACILFIDLASKPCTERALWAKERTNDIYIDAISVCSDSDWRHNTRISKETFSFLEEELGPHIKKEGYSDTLKPFPQKAIRTHFKRSHLCSTTRQQMPVFNDTLGKAEKAAKFLKKTRVAMLAPRTATQNYRMKYVNYGNMIQSTIECTDPT
ncbi:Hypothetical predicted protein [Mytilus galloprovincialis]|uniref:Uncharacterized protein n=1 Tax=Mytilus galloprovincialis TaxID=29158 RepID=A0A8B6C4F5_MYTGA|nr:Hypothetical predicted protein [Mytilus galloprovincialis]